ncbi:MAG: hypothetical protein ACP5PM_07870 [Acidimicrobiales bacterium]
MARIDVPGAAPVPPSSPPADTPADPEPPHRTPMPSIRPALVVVGVALLVVIVFGIGAALTTTPSSKVPRQAPLRGTGLVAVPAGTALHPIEILGTPPADVLDALVLPQGAQKLSASPWSGETQYSAKMSFQLATSQATLVDFFHTELRSRGWSMVNVGPARAEKGATEVLAQRASSDGWFWEAGVVVFPTAFGSASSHADVTRFSLDLYEMPDAT